MKHSFWFALRDVDQSGPFADVSCCLAAPFKRAEVCTSMLEHSGPLKFLMMVREVSTGATHSFQ